MKHAPGFREGQIVLIDWCGDALPKEANKLRPCIVVEDCALFDEAYPNVIVVPMKTEIGTFISALSVKIAPNESNGCKVACYAVAHAVVTASKSRIVNRTDRFVTRAQLLAIRGFIAESSGLVVGSNAA